MQRTRHNNRGQAYEEWKAARQLELDEEQRQRDAAAAQDPTVMYQQVADQEAQAIRELILTGYIPTELLHGVERINGRKVLEEPAIRNFKFFADNTPSFHRYMADALLSAAERSDLAPIAPNYTKLHNLFLQYSAYPEPPVQEAAPAEEIPPVVLPRSDQAVVDHQRYLEEVVGTDELGTQYTEAMLDQLDAKSALRLRRLFESGHRGSNLLTIRREILDIKAQQDAERARLAAEQEGGN